MPALKASAVHHRPRNLSPRDSPVSIYPTEDEREKLRKVSRAANTHYVALVILIGLASLTFLAPDNAPAMASVILGLLIIGVGASSMRIKHFQKCPRCQSRKPHGQAACTQCGLQYYASEPDEQ